MGTFGFSYTGLIFLVMLFVPNLIWAKHKPAGYSAENEQPVLRGLELAGQIGVIFVSLAFSNFNIHAWLPWSAWLIAAFCMMILYEFWWFRYFKSKKTLADFYSDFLGIPLAGATLPIAAFLLLCIYGKVIWLAIATIVLGIGHIGIHLQHAKELQR